MGVSYRVYGLIDIEDEEIKACIDAVRALYDAGILDVGDALSVKIKQLTGVDLFYTCDLHGFIEEYRQVDLTFDEETGMDSNTYSVDVNDIPTKVKTLVFKVSC